MWTSRIYIASLITTPMAKNAAVKKPFSMEVSMMVKKTGPVEMARINPNNTASPII
jgi:hypothetical protein